MMFNSCFADSLIQPTKYDYQEQILINGRVIIASKKINFVHMSQEDTEISDGKANFYFVITNNTNAPVNFYTSDLIATDQNGNRIKITSKKEIIDKKRRSKNWALFFSAIGAGFASAAADKAGEVKYQSNTTGNFGSNFNVHGSNKSVYGSSSGYHSTTTTGTIHSEALRQAAHRQASIDAQGRDIAIEAKYAHEKKTVENFYLDSNTIFPGSNYETRVLDKRETKKPPRKLVSFSTSRSSKAS